MEKSLGNMSEMIERVGESLEESGAVESFGSILESVSKLLIPLVEITSAVLPALIPLLDTAAWIVSLIADMISAITGLLSRIGLFDAVSNLMRPAWQNLLNGNSFGYSYDSASGSREQNMFGRNAGGTSNWRGGWSWVGENGPELAYLPQGSQVKTAQESRGSGGGDVFYITIDAKNVKEFNDLVRMAQEARMKTRKERGQ